MTLVVGRAVSGNTYLLSDTALTPSNGGYRNANTQGCIKCYIVHDHLAVAFADSSEAFDDHCGAILSMRTAEEISRYAASLQKGGWPVEVMAATAGASSLLTVKVAKVADSPFGFLGDAGAFDRYQRNLADPNGIYSEIVPNSTRQEFIRLPEPTTPNDDYGAMWHGLQAVIDDPAFPTVGGVLIPLCTDKGSFRYINYTYIRAPLGDVPKATWTTLDFGTPENGGYAIDLCTTLDGREVAIYFLQGSFGVVFPRKASGMRVAQTLRARDPARFVFEAHSAAGNVFGCCFTNAHNWGLLGEELLSQHRYADASFCFDLGASDNILKLNPVLRDRYISSFATALLFSGNPARALAEAQEVVKQHPNEASKCIKVLRVLLGGDQ